MDIRQVEFVVAIVDHGGFTRAAAVAPSPLTMWPRNDGMSSPSIDSKSAERGLANWPAMRPTFTTGTPPA